MQCALQQGLATARRALGPCACCAGWVGAPSSTRLPLTAVPFELPTSRSTQRPPSHASAACFWDTAESFMCTLLLLVRPTVNSSPGRANTAPALGPAVTSSRSTSTGAAVCGPLLLVLGACTNYGQEEATGHGCKVLLHNIK